MDLSNIEILPLIGYILLTVVCIIFFYLFIKMFYFDTIEYKYAVVSRMTDHVYYKTNEYEDAQRAVEIFSNRYPKDLIEIDENEDFNGDLNLTA